MGNCVTIMSLRRSTTEHYNEEENLNDQVLRIVKVDGKVLEYTTRLLVRDLLLNYDGYGVSVSPGASRCLSPEHELRVGRVYHLIPLAKKVDNCEDEKSDGVSSSRRIKVVLTKKQVQELLSKIQKEHEQESESCRASWKPKLETIFEESV